MVGRLGCPACHVRLHVGEEVLHCPACRRDFARLNGVPDLLLRESLTPAQRAAIAEWENGAEEYRGLIAALGERRFRAIDQPLLRIACGDVLEVGCGDGRLLAKLAACRPASLFGVDVARPLTRAARERGFDVALAAAERLPLPDASVDTVVSGYYALRFTDLDAALGEIARVLRPGGRFGLTLLGRRAVAVASRLAVLPLLRSRQRRMAARVLFGREPGTTLPTDVTGASELRRRLDRHHLALSQLLGTPYVPLVGAVLSRWTDGHLPYLRGEAAARLGFDVIAVGTRD